jgi:multiple sugar transport system ATP-binding protein
MQQVADTSYQSPTASRPATSIWLKGISKQYDSHGDFALRNIDLEIHDKELLVLLGPSGCGKSSTLNILAGLEEPTSGELFFGDQIMNNVPAEERDVSMVFQSIALYPHMDVENNITFPLRVRRVKRDVIVDRVTTITRMLGIDAHLKRKLHQLSGGERQRVAIAKALVKRPHLFLLDEPFSSLDADMRRQLRSELVRIHRQLETTMVFVTHDQEEAMSIAERIAVMRRGECMQLGTPLEVYYAPANAWISQFVGTHPINLFALSLDQSAPQVYLAGRRGTPIPMEPDLHARLAKTGSHEVIVGIRPEFVTLIPIAAAPAHAGWEGEIFTRQVLGTSILYDVRSDNDHVRAVTGSQDQLERGSRVAINFAWQHAFFFDRQTEERIQVSTGGTGGRSQDAFV